MSDSDEILSGTDEDDILQAIQQKPKLKKPRDSVSGNAASSAVKSTPKPLLDLDDEILIPTVFLTQGAKNANLLQKANTISKHIEEEREKARQQREEIDGLKREILAEINDNGSTMQYTSKSAHAFVELYLKNHFSNHYSLREHRHFYFFGDVYKVVLGKVPEKEKSLIETLLFLEEGTLHAYNQALLLKGVSAEHIAFWFIENCFDEAVLVKVLRFLQQYSCLGSMLLCLSESLEKVSGTKISFLMPLKIRQFNNNVYLSILRAAMLFAVYPATQNRETYILSFILASSDFYANKHHRETLREHIVRPVFKKIISFSEDVSAEFQLLWLQIKTHLYGKDPDDNKQKYYELNYNFLTHLHEVVGSEESKHLEVVLLLVKGFLHDTFDDGAVASLESNREPPSISGPSITVEDLSSVLFDSLPRSTSIRNSTTANSIYKYVFKARLCTKLLTGLLYGNGEKKPFLRLHGLLHTVKDALQHDMSQWLYVNNDVSYKRDVSTALSEAYHVIDHFSNVLNKNLPLIQNDMFYEDL